MHSRRQFMRTGLLAAGALALGPEFWEALARPAVRGPGPYGPLGPPDANGIALPAGFRARVIARGLLPVAGTAYVWHIFSDGAATFATRDGGWILVSNSEIPTPIDLPIDPPIGNPGEGGASAIRFSRAGVIVGAHRILSGTSSNCAGGATPWGTWLSCEETDRGLVWECDPTGRRPARARPALGAFTHEAVCVDPQRGHVYLSEDDGEGGLYRFTPRRPGDLGEGLLEIALVDSDRRVRWRRVPDPAARHRATRKQVPGSKRFQRGEGIFFDSGLVYLATTGDSRIWAYDVRRERIKVVYDPERIASPPLTDVDNITVHRQSGDLFVCEDNGAPDAYDMGIITPGGPDHRGQRRVARFLKLSGVQHGNPNSELSSEVAGVCFNPRGDRLYFASQRVLGVGAVYEVRGPFRKIR